MMIIHEDSKSAVMLNVKPDDLHVSITAGSRQIFLISLLTCMAHIHSHMGVLSGTLCNRVGAFVCMPTVEYLCDY